MISTCKYLQENSNRLLDLKGRLAGDTLPGAKGSEPTARPCPWETTAPLGSRSQQQARPGPVFTLMFSAAVWTDDKHTGVWL